MKEIQEKTVIPEKTIPETIEINKTYIADDGKVFKYKNECIKYENKIDFEKLAIFENVDDGIKLLDEKYTHIENICYIKNEKEAEIVLNYCNNKYYANKMKSIDDFYTGENLYIICIKTCYGYYGSYCDHECHTEILTFEEYSKVFKNYLNKIKNSVKK